MRKTTMYFRPEDDERIDAIKAAVPTQDQTTAIRYALMRCPLPKRSTKKK